MNITKRDITLIKQAINHMIFIEMSMVNAADCYVLCGHTDCTSPVCKLQKLKWIKNHVKIAKRYKQVLERLK